MLAPARWLLRVAVLLSLFVALGCGGGGGDAGASATRESYLLAGQSDLVEISLPSGGQKVLQHFGDSSVIDPSISPDGKLIAFVRVPDYTTTTVDFGTDIYVANRDGTNPTLLVKHAATSELLRWPLWPADGKSVIFSVQGQSANGLPASRLEKFDLATRQRRTFIEGASWPSLSRDGRTLVFQTLDLSNGDNVLWLADATSGNRAPIVKSTQQFGSFGAAVLSPDNTQVVFGAATLGALAPQRSLENRSLARGLARLDGLPEDVWLVKRDGTGLRQLTSLKEDQPAFAWSSDGRWIYCLGGGGLYQIDAAKGSKKRIAEGIFHGEIVWLPPAP